MAIDGDKQHLICRDRLIDRFLRACGRIPFGLVTHEMEGLDAPKKAALGGNVAQFPGSARRDHCLAILGEQLHQKLPIHL